MGRLGTQLVGLIGWPVEHSVSPPMHNAAFAELGMDWRYTLLPTEPGALETQLRRLLEQGYRGVNVTVPHKETIMLHMDRISATARDMGAVNTVVFGEEGLAGENTDGQGFLDSLRHAGFSPSGQQALILGAGGGARAVVHALVRAGCDVTLFNRSLQRASLLQQDIQSLGYDVSVLQPASAPWIGHDLDRWNLLVNTTPVGMWPDTAGSPWPEAVPIPPHWTVFDLVYNPVETRLLHLARESGAQPIDGLEMLVRQGALSFQMWTGIQPPLHIMRKAARATLENNDSTYEE